MSDNSQWMPGKKFQYTEQRVERLERMVAHLFRALHEAQESNKANLADLKQRMPNIRWVPLTGYDQPNTPEARWGEPQTSLESPETPETEEVPQWAPTWPESTGNGEEGCTVQTPWGPPKPGTHESDLHPNGDYWLDDAWRVDRCLVRGGRREWGRAATWSKEHA